MRGKSKWWFIHIRCSRCPGLRIISREIFKIISALQYRKNAWQWQNSIYKDTEKLLKKEGNVDKKNIMAYKFKNSTTAHSVNKTLLDLKI